MRRGGVTLGISTDGAAPALAGLLREALDAMLPVDLETWSLRAHEMRRSWKARGVPMEGRRPELLEALNALYESRRDRAPRTSLRARASASLKESPERSAQSLSKNPTPHWQRMSSCAGGTSRRRCRAA